MNKRRPFTVIAVDGPSVAQTLVSQNRINIVNKEDMNPNEKPIEELTVEESMTQPIQEEVGKYNPKDIKERLENRGYKIILLKRGMYKGKMAPKGLTHLILRLKGNAKIYEAVNYIKVEDSIEQNNFTLDGMLVGLYKRYIEFKGIKVEQDEKYRGNE